MQLTENEMAVRVGLPGPVIAALLQPEGHAADYRHYRSDIDVLRAEVANLMLIYGVRMDVVRTAMKETPQDLAALHEALEFWQRIVPAPVSPRQWSLVATGLASALVLMAMLAGMMLGAYLAPNGLP